MPAFMAQWLQPPLPAPDLSSELHGRTVWTPWRSWAGGDLRLMWGVEVLDPPAIWGSPFAHVTCRADDWGSAVIESEARMFIF